MGTHYAIGGIPALDGARTIAIAKRLIVCVDNEGYEVPLKTRKVYVPLCDPTAEKHDLLRPINESSDNYSYPKTFFHELSYLKQQGRH